MGSNIKSPQISNQNFSPPKNVGHTRVSGSDYRLTVDGYSGNAGDTLRWDLFCFFAFFVIFLFVNNAELFSGVCNQILTTTFFLFTK